MRPNDTYKTPPGMEIEKLKKLIVRTADDANNSTTEGEIITFINANFETSLSDVDDITPASVPPGEARRIYATVATYDWT